jgi:hypothetical protein
MITHKQLKEVNESRNKKTTGSDKLLNLNLASKKEITF